jgi:hypothetical protein
MAGSITSALLFCGIRTLNNAIIISKTFFFIMALLELLVKNR